MMDKRQFTEFFYDEDLDYLNREHSFLQNILGTEYDYYEERLKMLRSGVFLYNSDKGIMRIVVKFSNHNWQYSGYDIIIFKGQSFPTKRTRVKRVLNLYLEYWERVLQSQLINNN